MTLLEELASVFETSKQVTIGIKEIPLLEALDSHNFDVKWQAQIRLKELGKNLSKIIVTDSRFPGDSTKAIRRDNSAGALYPHFIAAPLIRRALERNSPEEAVEWLLKVINTTAATGNQIQALWGVPVENEIWLNDEVKIVPIHQLPESPLKQWVTGRIDQIGEPLSMPGYGFDFPESALVISRRIEPFLYDSEIESCLNAENFHKAHQTLKEITLALTVIGPRVVLPAVHWFTYDDADFEQSGMQLAVRGYQNIEILPTSKAEYPPLCATEAKEIIPAYLALSGSAHDKIKVALQRLSQSLRRHNIGDRAVELSIAFEALLGDSDNNEMTHKIKVRSVRLIGGTNEIRKMNAAVMAQTYSIRSKLVHTGHINTVKPKEICGQRMEPSEVIDYATNMCADLIKIMIRRGEIPDWPIFDITEHH